MPENPKSPRDQFVDEVLDAALRQYGRSEAPPGLENRVLRRLEEAPRTTQWLTGWRWSAAGAVATIVVVALALMTYPPESTRVGPSPKTDSAPGASVGSGAAGTASPAGPGAAEQRKVVPQIVVPPPNRAPRFNKTIQQSGVRPGGVRPSTGALPPCKPGQVPANTAGKPGAEKEKTKTSPDCVPAIPVRQQPHTPPK